MQDWKSLFKGKKITIMGLGLLGRGVGDAKFLAELGAELIVTDLKSEAELAPSLRLLKDFPNITYRLGGHDLADFRERDYVLKAAGIPLNSAYIAEARKNGIPIKMSASWFAELAKIPVVGVTGTRGKSTVTHMLHAIMKEAGMDVILGGNIRGVSTLALLPEVKADSIALMELDSWQCQGFGEAGISPEVAVFTNLMPDHLNYYPDMDAYLADKAQIFLNQNPEDTLVVGPQVAGLLKEKYASKIRSHAVFARAADFPKGWHLKVLGEHNVENAACAIDAARALGVEETAIRRGIESFESVPGRLEFLREVNGIQIWNDNNSTTPEATLAALRALKGPGTILILGGSDKKLDMEALLAEIPKFAKKTVCLAGSGTERIASRLPECKIHGSLADALQDAYASASPGDKILFSPAFASFGMFKNEYDRGDQFTALVKKL
jgi:UDP-N-acetylmuramoylalanine--D-glutamate ligase